MSLPDWWYGIVGLNPWGAILYTLVVTHVTIVSVTVYLHRFSAHRALELHPGLQHFFRFWLWLTTGMVTVEWTAIHRKHHVTTETEDDPHSPRIHGLRAILFRGTEFYRAGATADTVDRYGKGTPEDWLERNVYSRFLFTGIVIVAVADIVLFGSIGIVVFGVQMLWIPFFAAGVINGVGHFWGYRNVECPDAATNIVPWGILIGGEELHNNHHTYPNSAKLSVRPWEIDLGWFWIRCFQLLGLAKPLYTGPVVERVNGKKQIDMDTTWAVLNDRFEVMARYAEEVVGPLVEEEYRRADKATRQMLKRAKSILCREETLIKEVERQRISRIVDNIPVLATIYEMRIELQAVWSKRGGNGDELLIAFKEWCSTAEATGIQALGDFVVELKSYSVPRLVSTTS
ncbi:MAG: fatty acid desaturase [Pseudomonadota bacterium]|nr:fatty acid desaturase [Pseudomonadota bacterium]